MYIFILGFYGDVTAFNTYLPFMVGDTTETLLMSNLILLPSMSQKLYLIPILLNVLRKIYMYCFVISVLLFTVFKKRYNCVRS